jgi:hypothetical protein
MTRDDIRNTASTLAHYWCAGNQRDHEGVRRIILSHAVDMRPALCANMLRFIEQRGGNWGAFEGLLCDLAGLDNEDDERDEQAAMLALAMQEQARDAG